MLKLLPNLPAGYVGIEASGQVDAKDYETVLVPAVEEALKQQDKVRILYVLSAEFTGFTAGAMWDDLVLGMSHYRSWEKIAVVTDQEWIAQAIKLFRFMMPCPVKIFALTELPQAEQWMAK